MRNRIHNLSRKLTIATIIIGLSGLLLLPALKLEPAAVAQPFFKLQLWAFDTSYDGAPGDRYGWSVAVDGSVIVAGAYGYRNKKTAPWLVVGAPHTSISWFPYLVYADRGAAYVRGNWATL